MIILGLRTVISRVPELAAAKVWYRNAFEVAPYFDEPYYVGFNIAGYELGLDPTPPSAPRGQAWRSHIGELMHLSAHSINSRASARSSRRVCMRSETEPRSQPSRPRTEITSG